MINNVKIISGKLKGRNISFPDIDGLRPTLSRVRETMFAWLDQDIYGAKCLDLFAGSGALGFEAYSRGAGFVFMLESNPKVVASIAKNIERLHLDSVKVICSDYRFALEEILLFAPYDFVFIDPPYSEYDLFEILSWVDQNGLLAKDGACIFERGLQSDCNFPIMYNVKKLKKTSKFNYGLLVYDNLGK